MFIIPVDTRLATCPVPVMDFTQGMGIFATPSFHLYCKVS